MGEKLEKLTLSLRVYNALRRSGISDIEKLASLTEEQLYSVRNLGEKGITEINSALAAYDKTLVKTRKKLEEKHSQNLGHLFSDLEEIKDSFSDLTNISLNPPIPLKELDLAYRTYNALCRTGIDSVNQLLSLSEDEIEDIYQIGEKASQEIILKLKPYKDLNSLTNKSSNNPSYPIMFLSLPFEVKNKLYAKGYKEAGDLLRLETETIDKIKSSYPEFGDFLGELTKTSISQDEKIKKVFSAHGLHFPDDLSWKSIYLASSSLPLTKSIVEELKILDDTYLANFDDTLLNVEAIEFLLEIGCPIELIDIDRSLSDGHTLKKLKLHKINNCFDLFLTSENRLLSILSDLGEIKKEIDLYADWLGNQLQWEKEIKGESPSIVTINLLASEPIEKLIYENLAEVSIRNREIYFDYRFSSDKHTLASIGEKYSITRERARQIVSQVDIHFNGLTYVGYFSELKKIIIILINDRAIISGEKLIGLLKNEYGISGIKIGIIRVLLQGEKSTKYHTEGIFYSVSQLDQREIDCAIKLASRIIREEKIPISEPKLYEEYQSEINGKLLSLVIFSTLIENINRFLKIPGGYWGMCHVKHNIAEWAALCFILLCKKRMVCDFNTSPC